MICPCSLKIAAHFRDARQKPWPRYGALSLKHPKSLCRPTSEQAIWRQSAELPLPICALAPLRLAVIPSKFLFLSRLMHALPFRYLADQEGTVANDVYLAGRGQHYAKFSSMQATNEEWRTQTWLPSYMKAPCRRRDGGGSRREYQ